MSTRHLTSKLRYVLAISSGCFKNSIALRDMKVLQPFTDWASEASNINSTKHEILAHVTRKASFRALFKSTTPATVFATLTESCVQIPARATRKVFWTSKRSAPNGHASTILIPKSLSRRSVVQILQISTSKSAPFIPGFTDFGFRMALSQRGEILPTSTSKTAPRLPVFDDFDCRTALSLQRGANFDGVLGSPSFANPALRSRLCEFARWRNYEQTAGMQFL